MKCKKAFIIKQISTKKRKNDKDKKNKKESDCKTPCMQDRPANKEIETKKPCSLRLSGMSISYNNTRKIAIFKFSPRQIFIKQCFKFHTLDLLFSETRTFPKIELHGWTKNMSSTPALHSSYTSTATHPVENMVDVTDFGHANDVRENVFLRKTLYFMVWDTMRQQRIFIIVPLINTFKLKNTFSFS